MNQPNKEQTESIKELVEDLLVSINEGTSPMNDIKQDGKSLVKLRDLIEIVSDVSFKAGYDEGREAIRSVDELGEL